MKWIKQKLWLMKFRWISFKTGPMPWSKPRRWHRRNLWFGGGSEQEKLMTMTAFGLHSEAINMGLDAEEQPYYEYLDGQMRERFPEYPGKN